MVQPDSQTRQCCSRPLVGGHCATQEEEGVQGVTLPFVCLVRGDETWAHPDVALQQSVPPAEIKVLDLVAQPGHQFSLTAAAAAAEPEQQQQW